MEWKGLPTVIFGSGGNSRETLFLIEEINRSSNNKIVDFIGFIGKEKYEIGKKINGYEIICSDSDFEAYTNKMSMLGVVIPIGTPNINKAIFNRIKHIKNLVFPNLIHPSVVFDEKRVSIGIGNIITSSVTLTLDINIGNFNFINRNSTIGHDVNIGDFNIINPLTSISGDINIGNECLIGTGTTILQGINIGDNSIVGAGAVVTEDVKENDTVVGVPAKTIK